MRKKLQICCQNIPQIASHIKEIKMEKKSQENGFEKNMKCFCFDKFKI